MSTVVTFDQLRAAAKNGKLTVKGIDAAISRNIIDDDDADLLRSMIERRSAQSDQRALIVTNLDAGLPTDAQSIKVREHGVTVPLSDATALHFYAKSGTSKSGTPYLPRTVRVAGMKRTGGGWTADGTRPNALVIVELLGTSKPVQDKCRKAVEIVTSAWGGFAQQAVAIESTASDALVL